MTPSKVGSLLEECLEGVNKQPLAKAGGFELRTENPDTRRLNNASYSGSILKLSFGFGSRLCFDIQEETNNLWNQAFFTV